MFRSSMAAEHQVRSVWQIFLCTKLWESCKYGGEKCCAITGRNGTTQALGTKGSCQSARSVRCTSSFVCQNDTCPDYREEQALVHARPSSTGDEVLIKNAQIGAQVSEDDRSPNKNHRSLWNGDHGWAVGAISIVPSKYAVSVGCESHAYKGGTHEDILKLQRSFF